ncbi:MAG: glycosyltransferase family 4 protein [Nitrososphaerales archaeon]
MQTKKIGQEEARPDYEQQSSSPRRKTICYLAPDVPIPSPRGSSVHVAELSKNLNLLGHEVHVICRRTGKDEPNFEKLDGFTVHRIFRFIVRPGASKGSIGRSASETKHGFVAFFYYLYLRTIFSFYTSFIASSVMRKNKLEAILERETSFGAGGLASLFARKPMILEIVGPRYSRISVWRSKKILYYSESMLRKWVDRNKCIEVSGGVNLSLFREDKELREKFRKKLGFGPEDKVIGYVGTFQDWHGIDTLLYSMEELRTAHPNLRALLVGPYYEGYKALAKNLGLDNLSTFTGPIGYELVVGYINACDIMVALYEPDRNELRKRYGIGSPLKVLEYMACGKPVISTNVKPIDKVLYNKDSGYLVEPGNRKALIGAISNLLEDSSLANSLAANGRRITERYYSWRSLANTIDNIL